MDFTHFTAGKDDSERRLDRILRRFLNEENLSSIYKLLRKGLVKVNGKKADGNFRVSEGDDIQIADFLLSKTQFEDENSDKTAKHAKQSPLSKDIIIFKNESVLILNKPYDIPVQPSASSNGKSLAEIVQSDYELTHKNTSLAFRTGPLHRLDRKTTGLIAFSQNLDGAKWFSEKIKSHEIQKVYLAILEGNLTQNAVWEDHIQKLEVSTKGNCTVSFAHDEGFHTVSVNSSDEGKFAHTEVFPLSHARFNGKEVTLARILITTGRTHQIRSQCAYHGFPLLGDTAYGGTKIDSKKFGQDFFLHAAELYFPKDNPIGLPEKLCAPVPEFFSTFH
jgi:23S rRNA pseudouridine955/2504/2580 synthase